MQTTAGSDLQLAASKRAVGGKILRARKQCLAVRLSASGDSRSNVHSFAPLNKRVLGVSKRKLSCARSAKVHQRLVVGPNALGKGLPNLAPASGD